jgi:hypothetical protein
VISFSEDQCHELNQPTLLNLPKRTPFNEVRPVESRLLQVREVEFNRASTLPAHFKAEDAPSTNFIILVPIRLLSGRAHT